MNRNEAYFDSQTPEIPSERGKPKVVGRPIAARTFELRSRKEAAELLANKPWIKEDLLYELMHEQKEKLKQSQHKSQRSKSRKES